MTPSPSRLLRRSADLMAVFFAFAVLGVPPGVADDLMPRPTMGEILRCDPAADELLPPDATIEVLASGLDRGLPDGLKTDATGHLWATGPGGVHVMTPEGKLLARLDTKMACGNCCFGGDDGSWLYICSDAFLVRVKTKTQGVAWREP